METDPHEVTLRPAALCDSDVLLRWRNDPETRANSWNSAPVSDKEHRDWLVKTLANPERRLFIAELHGIPVGTARADFKEGGTELSWTVAPEHRAKGLGKAIVRAAVSSLPGKVTARIKSGNESSIRIAQSAGMSLVREADGIQEWST